MHCTQHVTAAFFTSCRRPSSWPSRSPWPWAPPHRRISRWSQFKAERSARLSRRRWWEARGRRSRQETRRWLQTSPQPERTLRRSVCLVMIECIFTGPSTTCWYIYHIRFPVFVFPFSSLVGFELRWRLRESARASCSRDRARAGRRFCD